MSDLLCYVDCNNCSTILAVNVPYGSLFKIVTVRCGHCVEAVVSTQSTGALQAGQVSTPSMSFENYSSSYENRKDLASSSAGNEGPMIFSGSGDGEARISINRPPEKRQRVPSAYNRFIKEEIQRIKAVNPEISHREAFSTAAKNWAHFPRIHFGLTTEIHKQDKADDEDGDEVLSAEAFCATNDGRLSLNRC
uniref:YABBY transcription factor n=1 Tax=Zamia vazquezii TaxID=501451 RepID=A0A140KQE4_9SPER|nr:YABBY transcription factor [Zamia vazquezii]